MHVLLISVQNNLDVIGIKNLHYYLLANGYNSSLLHLPNFNSHDPDVLKNIGRFVSETTPGFIGISLMSTEYDNARELTKYLKSEFPSIPVIWGGIHPTICPEASLECADYVCIGEGEKTVIDFARAIADGENPTSINNICYLEDGEVKKNRLYPLIENLDEIPPYEHVPANSFIQEKGRQIIPVDKRVFKKYARYRGTTYSIMSSRGCPFSCTYCCNNFLSNLYQTKKIRRRSAENVIAELEKAVKDNPEIEYINFQDDCFLACSEEYLSDFCRIYTEKIYKPFVVRAIPTYITRNKIKALKDSGLAWISLGLQSGSDRTCRDIYRRKSLKADFLKAAGIIKEFNIAAFYDVILDNPFEDEQDNLETVRTLIETPKPFFCQIFSLSLYLGTELYERAKEECPDKIEDSLRKEYLLYHKNTLNNMVRLAVYLSPKVMRKIVDLYQKDKNGLRFKAAMFFGNLASTAFFEPLTYFRVIKLSQGGSFFRALAVLPNYFQEGFMRYISQFKTEKK